MSVGLKNGKNGMNKPKQTLPKQNKTKQNKTKQSS
jgi:hypothetical protein